MGTVWTRTQTFFWSPKRPTTHLRQTVYFFFFTFFLIVCACFTYFSVTNHFLRTPWAPRQSIYSSFWNCAITILFEYIVSSCRFSNVYTKKKLFAWGRTILGEGGVFKNLTVIHILVLTELFVNGLYLKHHNAPFSCWTGYLLRRLVLFEALCAKCIHPLVFILVDLYSSDYRWA